MGKIKLLSLKEKVRKLEQEKEMSSPRKVLPQTKNEKGKKLNAGVYGKVQKEIVIEKNLKGPELPQGLVDTDQAKERFEKVKEVLEKKRISYEDKVNEVDNLIRTEDILNICKQHYIEMFGISHKDVPPLIAQLESFNMVNLFFGSRIYLVG